MQQVDVEATKVVVSIGGLVVACAALLKFGTLAGRWEERHTRMQEEIRDLKDAQATVMSRDEITGWLNRLEKMLLQLITIHRGHDNG